MIVYIPLQKKRGLSLLFFKVRGQCHSITKQGNLVTSIYVTHFRIYKLINLITVISLVVNTGQWRFELFKISTGQLRFEINYPLWSILVNWDLNCPFSYLLIHFLPTWGGKKLRGRIAHLSHLGQYWRIFSFYMHLFSFMTFTHNILCNVQGRSLPGNPTGIYMWFRGGDLYCFWFMAFPV
jgi:hypothetical protein